MFRIKYFSFVTALVIYTLAAGSPTVLQAASNTCKIVISTKDFTTSVFYPKNGPYQKAYSIEGRDYSISPNQKILAMEASMESSERVDGKQIIFYDLTAQQPLQLATAPNTSIIRGSAWSHDNTKVLLDDAYFNHLLYLYDLKSQSLQFIFRSFDPILETYAVEWSPNDQYVAFVGGDGPIFSTEYADVTALYILDIKTLKYRAISLPDENVEYYFGSFYWIDNNSVAFTRCSKSNNEQCGIRQTTIDGKVIAEFEGNYWLTGYDGNHQLEVLDLSHQGLDAKGTVDLSILDLNSKSFTFIERFPVDRLTPYPIFSLSSDREWLIYKNETRQSVIKNLKTSTTSIINQSSDWIAQLWSIDDNRQLFPTESGFYIYDIDSGSSHLAFNYSDMKNISSYNLLCGEKST